MIYAYTGDPPPDFDLGQFADATGAVDGSDAGDLSVTIDWGDGSAPSAGTLTLVTGQNLPSGADYLIDGTPPYTATGDYTATVTVAMAGGASYTVQIPVTVLNGDPPIAIVDPLPGIGPERPPVSAIVPSSGITATATAPVTANLGTVDFPTGNYVLEINWGDGSSPTDGTIGTGIPLIQGGLTLNDFHDLTGTHTYARPGTYTVTMNLVGPLGVSEWASTEAVVSPSLLRLSGNPDVWQATQGQPMESVPGQFTYPPDASGAYLSASSFVAAIDWRDGSPPTFARVELMLPPGQARPYNAVDAAHTYRTPGFFTPYINVIAPDGESAWVAGKVAVGPDPMAPTNITANGPLGATQGIASGDYVLATFDAPAGAYSAAVDWGDGSDTFATVLPLGPSGDLTEYGVSGSHTYASTGDKRVLVNILAPNGDSD